MRISFDLDDTLICYADVVPAEPRRPWYRRLLVPDEPMRLGTPQLFADLHERGWEIWVYTTSHRSPRSIRRWFAAHGIRIDGVVNQRRHQDATQSESGKSPSKNPAKFGIDLHVDDLPGVQLEGQQHGFSVVVISTKDQHWVETVLKAADEFERYSLG